MRRIILCTVFMATVLLVAGCAKTLSSKTNEQAQIYYNAWVKVKKDANPEYLWWPVCYGTPATADDHERDYCYILQDFPGDGEEIVDSSYLFLEYTTYDLDGNVLSTTDKETSHRTGVDYDPTNYYGPIVLVNTDYSASIGFKDAICGIYEGEQVYDRMRIGGRRTVVVPGWLSGNVRYSDDITYYMDNVTGTDCIYDAVITDMTDDIEQYQIDSIKAYCLRKYRIRDSVYTGFYYKCIDAPRTTITLPDDTTIYINYVGRLLNGQVFDTNIADTAKVWNLYDATNTYAPAELNWSSDSTAITLGSDASSVISGFASTVLRMNDKETAVGVFYSNLGYGSSGSGTSIPGYAPLEFEISIVDSE